MGRAARKIERIISIGRTFHVRVSLRRKFRLSAKIDSSGFPHAARDITSY